MSTKKQHVVFDARIIESSTGRYVQRILEHVNTDTARLAHTRYTALIPSQYIDKWQRQLPHITFVAADQPWYSFSEQLSLPILLAKLRPDLVNFMMPQQPILWFGRTVTTIHDTILLDYDNIDDIHPLIYRMRKSIFYLLLRLVVARSKAILAPTHTTKQRIIHYCSPRVSRRIHVIPLAGETPHATPEHIPQLTKQSFLLYVGNAFPYKNVARVIDGFAAIKPDYPELQLALVGKKEYFYEQLEADVAARGIKDVHFLGFVSDGQKRWALQHTEAFITASKAEGFCMPLLESMVEGAPVVASNASCLPEVVGPAALLFDPDSTDDLARNLRKLLDSPAERKRLIAAGHRRAGEFSWQETGDQTLAVLNTCLK